MSGANCPWSELSDILPKESTLLHQGSRDHKIISMVRLRILNMWLQPWVLLAEGTLQ